MFVARSLLAAGYTAQVGILIREGAEAGLGVIGNAHSKLILMKRGEHLELSQVVDGTRKILWETEIARTPIVWLRVNSSGHADATFSYSLDNKQWIAAASTESVTRLPPWDQGLRIGLIVDGQPGTKASFVHFSLVNATDSVPDAKD